jgi:hypothetical protein
MKGRKLTVIKGGLNQEKPWSRRRRRLQRLSFCLGLTLLALILVGSAGSFVIRARVSQEIIRLTTLDSQIPFVGILLKHEQEVLAPVAGTFIPIIDSGARVRVGQQLGVLQTATGDISITSEAAGIFISRLDGLEQDFPRRETIDLELLAAAQWVLANPKAFQAVTTVETEKPLAVILNNSYIQLLGRLRTRPSGSVNILSFVSNGRTLEHQAQVKNALEYSGSTWLLWEIGDLPDELSLGRIVSGSVWTRRDEAARLPAGALVWKNNRPGVLLQTRQGRIFQEVEVLHSQEGEVWLGGLQEGQQILVFAWGTGILKWWWLR